jgi:hypothetical protein
MYYNTRKLSYKKIGSGTCASSSATIHTENLNHGDIDNFLRNHESRIEANIRHQEVKISTLEHYDNTIRKINSYISGFVDRNQEHLINNNVIYKYIKNHYKFYNKKLKIDCTLSREFNNEETKEGSTPRGGSKYYHYKSKRKNKTKKRH